MACLFGHKWDGCVCSKCGEKRDKEHKWEGFVCSRCGKSRKAQIISISLISVFFIAVITIGALKENLNTSNDDLVIKATVNPINSKSITTPEIVNSKPITTTIVSTQTPAPSSSILTSTTIKEETVTAVNESNITVYWGKTGDKIHKDPDCRTFKYEPYSGTIEEAYSAGRYDWCQICS